MSGRSSFLGALRDCAGTRGLPDSFADAVAASPKTAAKVADSLRGWANNPGPVPAMGRSELRPFVDTTWTRVVTRKAEPGVPAVKELLSRAGDQVSLHDPAAEGMLKLLLLYCHSVLIPVEYLIGLPRDWLIEGREVLARMIRFYSHLAPLIDAGVVIPVPDRVSPYEDKRALDLAIAADDRGANGGSRDPLGPIPAEVAADVGPQSHDWYRDTRLRIACRSIVHGQAMLQSIDDRGCLLLPGRRWANLVNLADVRARRLGTALDENAIITELMDAPLPVLDNQRLSLTDICALRGTEAFEQWRSNLAQALDRPASSAGTEWGEASARVVEATSQLRASLNRSRVKEFVRKTRVHFGIFGTSAAVSAPLHLLVPPAAAVEGTVVASVAALEWFKTANTNKHLQGSLAHHAALFEPPPSG